LKSKIAIIGAGFSGIAMAIELLKHGITDFQIYESAGQLGGTWRDNTYPGCACDVPSHVYSFSFAPNPDWSRAYSPQPEILAYMQRVARDFGVMPYITFNTEVLDATFDEPNGSWTLNSTQGVITCKALILGMGGLSRPAIPNLNGLQEFEGAVWHSARWNHDFDLKGKRVACIGTGASAIQFIPEIAPFVDQLDVYQRTPPWVIPRSDRPYSKTELNVFQKVPAARTIYRTGLYGLSELRGAGFVTDYRILKAFQKLAERHIRQTLSTEPELLNKVLPDYTIGCKRILMSNTYYPALMRRNVEVITEPIQRIWPDSIESDERRPYDAIIFGTGFHVTDFMDHFPIAGLNGVTLTAAWKDGAEAYYGTTVAGFPNLFLMVGPNTGLGHNSIISIIEAQTPLVYRALDMLERSRARYLDTDPQKQAEHNSEIQSRLQRSVWQSGCKSWYQQHDGKITTLWPKYTWQYHLETQRIPDNAFILVP